MLELGLINYVPTLRWKKGEYEALATLDDGLKDRILPNIILPPISARDNEKNQKLTGDEFAPVQIGRLAKYWGRRPCLVDFRFIEFGNGILSDARVFTAFLSTSAKLGCAIIPLFDLQLNEHRLSSIRDYWLQTKYGLALRLSLSDLDRKGLDAIVQKRLLALNAKPSDCILLIDFSDADLSHPQEFARFAHDWLFKLQQTGMWQRTVIQATNYPEQNPAKPNGSAKIGRNEWLVWEQLFGLDPRVRELAMFGDFGADNAKIDFAGGYAIRQKWIVARAADNGSIREVANRIAALDEFDGPDFSVGDQLIASWASGSATSGGAFEWRKANMSHHWTRVLVDLGALINSPIQPKRRPTIPFQQDLFSFGQ